MSTLQEPSHIGNNGHITREPIFSDEDIARAKHVYNHYEKVPADYMRARQLIQALDDNDLMLCASRFALAGIEQDPHLTAEQKAGRSAAYVQDLADKEQAIAVLTPELKALLSEPLLAKQVWEAIEPEERRALERWHVFTPLYEPLGNGAAEPSQEQDVPASGDEELSPKTEAGAFSLTDTGNAQRLVARHGQDLRYCFLWKKWLVWDKQRWELDTKGAIYQKAKDTARAIATDEAKGVDDTKEFAALLSWSKQSLNAARLKAMVELAQSEPGIPIQPDELDANPWLLNVENGTVDLQTGELREHRRADLLTKLAPVQYDAMATAPTWETFLQRIMGGDADLIAYLQRAAGYTLTGDAGEECLFFLHGTGRNGKTKLMEALGVVMGDYGTAAEFSTFLHKEYDAISNDLAALRGARYVTASEANEGRRLNESLIKNMTGGDTIKARFLFSEFFTFRPIFKLWLAANHKPVIRGTDGAIWERIKLIPFSVTIPEGERDKRLLEKFKAEGSGILLWMLEGLYSWRLEGLNTPEKVTAATAEYRTEMDVLGGFFAECCVLRADLQAPAADLFAGYQTWAKANGEQDTLSQTAFGLRLRERGLEKDRSSLTGKIMWRGVGLAQRAEE